MPDPVNHPSHYNVGKIEVIAAIDDWKLGFCEGNAVKYIARAKHKGRELEDLKKAVWYLNHRIEQLESCPPQYVAAPSDLLRAGQRLMAERRGAKESRNA